jgi:hypothetical protein
MSGFEACNNVIDGLYFDASFGDDAVFSNNLYTREVLSQYDVEPDKIYEPDLSKIFVDPENGDYHLRSGSPAINRGIDAGVSKDYDGITRSQEGDTADIGPFEFVTVHEAPDKITITAPSSVGLEQEFTVDVGFESIDEELKVLVADIGIAYDAGTFDYLGYTKADDGLDVIESNTDTPGEIRFVLANTGVENAITDNVGLLRLNFKSKDTLGSGMINVTSAEFSAVGKVDDSIPYKVNPDLDNITVSVLNKILGDIDNSGAGISC